MKLKPTEFESIIKTALKEDIGSGDITTNNLISPTQRIRAKIITKESGVIAGLYVAKRVFKTLDPTIIWKSRKRDGSFVKKNEVIAWLEGRAKSILTAERTALNFLQHLSGIATLTRKFVDKSKVQVYDTRKTLPGLRKLEKYAVACGGGFNHRQNLSEMVLIKENHIKVCKQTGLHILPFIGTLRGKIPRDVKIEIEVQDLRELKSVLHSKNIDIIMLDNMSFSNLKKAVKMIKEKRPEILIEVSGGINFKNIQKISKLDIDRLSVGAITHSAKALNISLEVV